MSETTAVQTLIESLFQAEDKAAICKYWTYEELCEVDEQLFAELAFSVAGNLIFLSSEGQESVTFTANEETREEFFLIRDALQAVAKERIEREDEQESADAETDPIPFENAALRADLQRLWANNHLTMQHVVAVKACPDGVMAYCVLKNGEPYNPNEKLVDALRAIYNAYEFDLLEFWACCHDCGNVVFERTIDGVVHDAIVDADGNVEDVPTSGVDEE